MDTVFPLLGRHLKKLPFLMSISLYTSLFHQIYASFINGRYEAIIATALRFGFLPLAIAGDTGARSRKGVEMEFVAVPSMLRASVSLATVGRGW